jgi:hypothetical protein
MKYTVLIFLFITFRTAAQELNCKVDVNYQNLPVNNRELLADFTDVVQNYMNTTRFTNEDWAQKIDCSLSIFFTGAGSDVDYSAQVVVVSQRPVFRSVKNSLMLTINDSQWQFRYERGQALYYNLSVFDPLTSLLDFYALIIIGMDLDTFSEFGGTQYFRRAQDIVNLGARSNSNFGWLSSSSTYSRWGLINDILSEKYAEFRSAIFDYHYGLDLFNQNRLIGQQNMVKLVNVLWDLYQKSGSINSVYIRTFFDAKNGEIIEYLTGYSDMEVFSKLKKIDPPHSARYDAVMP